MQVLEVDESWSLRNGGRWRRPNYPHIIFWKTGWEWEVTEEAYSRRFAKTTDN
jgi:hypothetical protein